MYLFRLDISHRTTDQRKVGSGQQDRIHMRHVPPAADTVQQDTENTRTVQSDFETNLLGKVCIRAGRICFATDHQRKEHKSFGLTHFDDNRLDKENRKFDPLLPENIRMDNANMKPDQTVFETDQSDTISRLFVLLY